jgi:aminoglycoside phosphotransferase (APT) family kinase protein
MNLSSDAIAPRLQAFLEKETGGSVKVEVVGHLAGGASRAAIALLLDVAAGPARGKVGAVLRLDLGGKIFEESLEREQEFRVIERAAAGGVPVPKPLWRSADPSVLGRPFLILERVEGETIGRRIVQLPELRGARKELPAQMGRALAQIHALDPRPLDFLPRPKPGAGPAERALDSAGAELARIPGPHPGLWAGWRWLREHAPDAGAEVLVHGDFRLGNVIVGPEGLRAVLDWEFASVGDPHEDLAWPYLRDWRFGNDDLRFAGLSGGEDYLAAYQSESGRRVDPGRLGYWEAMGNFRWAVGCLTQARRHTSGAEPSVELASLGRRSAEMELEMLDLLSSLEA